jgi:VIT1/CCC1 family predicted Fe2+/Mn2+ transporter
MKSINGFMESREEMEKSFLKDELLDHETYLRLKKSEKSSEIRSLLQRLADKEEEHIRIWSMLLGKASSSVKKPAFIGVRVFLLRLLRKTLGIGFVTRLLERDEESGLERYKAGLKSGVMSERDKKYLRRVIGDEAEHETSFAGKVEQYSGELGYTQSIILGLNDGLVEIVAMVAGLATVATSSFIVVIIGLIAGISGTLSMAGGVYLSSKSEGLVEDAMDKEKKTVRVSPSKEGYYTGIYYFVGALIAILPFIFGVGGAVGILLSIVLVSIALVIASTIIAVISGTSIRKRSLEMLAVSLGAAFVTILFGTFAKIHFGVSI